MTGAVSIAALCAMALGALLCAPPTIPGPRVPRIVRALAAYAGALVASGISRLALRLARRIHRPAAPLARQSYDE